MTPLTAEQVEQWRAEVARGIWRERHQDILLALFDAALLGLKGGGAQRQVRRYRLLREMPQLVIYRHEDRNQVQFALNKCDALDEILDGALKTGHL